MSWSRAIIGSTLFSWAIVSGLIAAPQNRAEAERGLWLSDGYGLLLEVSDDGFQAFELTSVSCLPGWKAKRGPSSSSGEESVFKGVFSDVLNRTLPNGWRFRLPNEVYLTSNGKAFDATGVPPDFRINFFSPGDLNNGRDAALEEAQRIIKSRVTACQRLSALGVRLLDSPVGGVRDQAELQSLGPRLVPGRS